MAPPATEWVALMFVAIILRENKQFFRPFDFFILIPVSYICIVTNNHIIMKKNKDSRIGELPIDFVEYLFVEWLCRREVFSIFKSNYNLNRNVDISFRGSLRRQIRSMLVTPSFGIRDLIDGSFIFDRTPEGRDFWSGVSSEWRRFCNNFRKEF